VLDTVKFVEKVLVEFVNDDLDAREEKRSRRVKGNCKSSSYKKKKFNIVQKTLVRIENM